MLLRLAPIFLVALAAPSAGQTVKSGVEAWSKGDPAAAVAIWRPLAAKGDTDAQFNLGQAYRLGKGVKLDLAQAKLWLEKAAAKGHVDAQTTVGLLMFQNGDQAGAMKWLQPAARSGEPRALLMVGTAAFNGDGIPKDPVKAYAYVSRAAAMGLAPAKATLADLEPLLSEEQKANGRALALQIARKKTPVAPSSAAVTNGAAVPKAPIKAAASPKPTPKPAPPASVVVAGKWRIQLGAFSQQTAAQGLYGRLQPKFAGRQPYYVRAGAVIRLQVGPYANRADASAACARLSPQACFPVEAR